MAGLVVALGEEHARGTEASTRHLQQVYAGGRMPAFYEVMLQYRLRRVENPNDQCQESFFDNL